MNTCTSLVHVFLKIEYELFLKSKTKSRNLDKRKKVESVSLHFDLVCMKTFGKEITHIFKLNVNANVNGNNKCKCMFLSNH